MYNVNWRSSREACEYMGSGGGKKRRRGGELGRARTTSGRAADAPANAIAAVGWPRKVRNGMFTG